MFFWVASAASQDPLKNHQGISQTCCRGPYGFFVNGGVRVTATSNKKQCQCPISTSWTAYSQGANQKNSFKCDYSCSKMRVPSSRTGRGPFLLIVTHDRTLQKTDPNSRIQIIVDVFELGALRNSTEMGWFYIDSRKDIIVVNP